jgi:hypothetical protein
VVGDASGLVLGKPNVSMYLYKRSTAADGGGSN